MKVTICETVDVETEVDVSLNDCISEMLEISEEPTAFHHRIKAIDGATKILAQVSPDNLEKRPGGATCTVKQLIRERLAKWIEFLEQEGGE